MPIATLVVPVVLYLKAFTPTLVFDDILPPPKPMFTEFIIASEPETSNRADGVDVPIPTFPLELIVILTEPLVSNCRF